MKILVLGENGMLGSQLMKTLSKNHEVYGTSSEKGYHINTINDIWKFDNIFRTNKPDVVINCIGIIKQKESTPEEQILINGLFPQEMAMICADCEVKFIQISTDCVFSGKKGDYDYDDFRDATDVYGMTKALGEINFDEHLTIRTSIIGHEKNTKYGLLEWFLHSEGKVSGYSNVWYSGVTTLELAKFINDKILKYDYSGIVHFVGPKINKYDLLNLIKKVYNKEIEIEKNVDVKLDRSLKSMGLVGCSWEQMLRELREDHSGVV
ncbi:MAG: SDR family oxidoreductase [Bacteroidales bacterium]|jgi:dTDP-4-dehydrorhamnose reductase|nr:SDR family oxidoreductase [Bacteroidales bacterium]